MKMLTLDSVLTFHRGITFKPTDKVDVGSEDSVVCFRTKNIQKQLDENDLISVPSSFVKRDELYIKKGDILISSANSWDLVGKCVQITKTKYTSTIGGFISLLRPISGVIDPDYLFWFLSSDKTQRQIRQLGKQTTNISNLDRVRFLQLEIPLPPLETQKQIAAVLRKADSLRQDCAQMSQELNTLSQAVFMDMFGDPVTNPKGWKLEKFSSLGILARGKSKHRPRNDPALLGGKYPLIQTGDIARAGDYIENYKSTYSELGLKQSKLWEKGTLCITIAANIADTSILTFDACFPDSVVGFTPNITKVRTEFIHYWLMFYQKVLIELAPESAQKNINLKILEDLDIYVPPMNLQNKFVVILTELQKTRTENKAQSVDLETAFQALTQKVFSGQLELTPSEV